MLLINGCNKITVIPNHMNSVDFIPAQKPKQNKKSVYCRISSTQSSHKKKKKDSSNLLKFVYKSTLPMKVETQHQQILGEPT